MIRMVSGMAALGIIGALVAPEGSGTGEAVPGAVLCLVLAYLGWYVLRFFAVWIGPYPLLGLLVAAIVLMIFGIIGRDLGLSYLFHPVLDIPTAADPRDVLRGGVDGKQWEQCFTQFCSGLAVMMMFLIVAVTVVLLDRGHYVSLEELATKRRRMSGRFWDWRHGTADVPSNPLDMFEALIFRPCLVLAGLCGVAAFLDIDASWLTRAKLFDPTSLQSDVSHVAWWWLTGLLAGLVVTWLVAPLLALLLASPPPRPLDPWKAREFEPGARWTIRLTLCIAVAAFLGVALRFRSASDLEHLRMERTDWWALAGFFALLGLVMGCLRWVGRRLAVGAPLRRLPASIVKRVLGGLACFGTLWLANRLAKPEHPLMVSLTLCALLAGVILAYAAVQTISVTSRLVIAIGMLLLLFIENGTNWTGPHFGPAEDYKLQFAEFDRASASAPARPAAPPGPARRISYYDYPVRLESRLYLESSYLQATRIVAASNDDQPIRITSAFAHRLRTGDRVLVTDVRGNAAANGLHVVVYDPKRHDPNDPNDPKRHGPNQFDLMGTVGSGDYTFGGEWIPDLETGRVTRIEADPTDPDGRRSVITSFYHGLKTGDLVRLADPAGRLIGPADRPVRVLGFERSDARWLSQFRIDPGEGGPTAADLAELGLVNGRWYPDPASATEGPKGGVAWVAQAPSAWIAKPSEIVITAFAGPVGDRDHGLRDGDRVQVRDVVAKPAANGTWTVRRLGPAHFALRNDPERVRPAEGPDPREFIPKPRDPNRGLFAMLWDDLLGGETGARRDQPAGSVSDLMSGGHWQRVEDRGRILAATNVPGRPIEVYSPSHGLSHGEHVEITGVQGNTRANGLWTVQRVDDDRFRLVGPDSVKDSWPKSDPNDITLLPHEGVGRSEFDYREGGEWRVAAYRGRLFAIQAAAGATARLSFYSPSHGLRPGAWIEISGLGPEPHGHLRHGHEEVPQWETFNGALFRVEAVEGGDWLTVSGRAVDDWFAALRKLETENTLRSGSLVAGYLGALAPLRSSQKKLREPVVHPIAEAVAEWLLVLDRGAFQGAAIETTKPAAERPRPAPVPSQADPIGQKIAQDWSRVEGEKTTGSNRVRLESPGHGLRPGDHVTISGDDWDRRGVAGTYGVVEVPGPDSFVVTIPPILHGPPPPRGRWRLAPDIGSCVLSPTPSDPRVRLHSAGHGLKDGDLVTVEGFDWAGKLKNAATFVVAVDPKQPEFFFLEGSKGLQSNVTKLTDAKLTDMGVASQLKPNDPRSPDTPSRRGETPGGGNLGAPADATVKLGTWRRLDRFPQKTSVLIARGVTHRGERLLRLDSPGHGLETGDRIRVERIGLVGNGIARGERFGDTFAVVRRDADTFVIRAYESWDYKVHGSEAKAASSLELIEGKGQDRSVLLAWRPILDRGIINGLRDGPDGSRLRIESPRHTLSPGAWVFVTDLSRRADNPATAQALRAIGTGPFPVVAADDDGFEIEVLDPEDRRYRPLPSIGRIEVGEMGRWCIAGLLDDREVLSNWSDSLLEAAHEDPRRRSGVGPASAPRRPKLAIITVSGGGIRSAVWTSAVLSRMEKEIPEFPYHTRIITGASGGMVGAAYYVATLRPPDPPTAAPTEGRSRSHHLDSRGGDLDLDPHDDQYPLVEHMARDSLARVANQLAFSDLPSMLWPAAWGVDRGQALEMTWMHNTAVAPEEDGPLSSRLAWPVQALAVGEWQGWRPSLVFTPMFVEDGRRLLVSNLNLDYAPRNMGHVLNARGTDKLSKSAKRAMPQLVSPRGEIDLFSLSAIEFFRVFPDAHNFRLSTAARMSAAFPLVTPAVSIPTVPPRRVVDAGYYDNYGVNLAALWLFQNREWLYEYTSGVVLIQIRDSQSERGRRELEDPDAPPSGGALTRLLRATTFSSRALDILDDIQSKASRGSQWLTSPLEGMAAARQANMSFRNDEQVEVLSNVINLWPDSPVKDQGFCTTVVFECPKEASLNWRILPRERRDIENGFDPDQIDPAYSEGARRNAERLRMLMRWWNR